MFVREYIEGCEVDEVLLVHELERRPRRDGGEFLRVVFHDRTGRVPATIWDDVEGCAEVLRKGDPVRVVGRFVLHPRHGGQLVVRALHPAPPGSYREEELVDGPPRAADQMERDLRDLLATVRDPHLRALLERFFGERSETWRRYRTAPAAKTYHQAYRHGLLEHSLTVAQAVGAVSAIFPGVDRDLAVTGALLHDIGKLDAYTNGSPAIEMTDAGRLQGEIPLGYYKVRRTIETIEGFPPAKAEAVLHIILAHHGALEHGSPVVPATREATLVHFLDNLGGRLGSFDRLEKQLPEGVRWSKYDRALNGAAYFPPPPGEGEQAQAA